MSRLYSSKDLHLADAIMTMYRSDESRETNGPAYNYSTASALWGHDPTRRMRSDTVILSMETQSCEKPVLVIELPDSPTKAVISRSCGDSSDVHDCNVGFSRVLYVYGGILSCTEQYRTVEEHEVQLQRRLKHQNGNIEFFFGGGGGGSGKV